MTLTPLIVHDPFDCTSSMLAVTNGASTKDILKGAAIDVVTGGAFQAFRINLKTLLSVDTIRAVGRHAVIGCLSSKAGGGSCSKGAAAAGAKLVTIGFPGGHSSGKLIAAIGVAGLVNGTNGAKNAVLGYLYNQLAPRLVPAPPGLGLPRGTMLPKSQVEAMVKHQNQVKNSVPSARSPHFFPSSSNSGKRGFWDRVGSVIEEYFGSGAGVTTSPCPQGHQCT